MAQTDIAAYKTFEQITGRLDEIIGMVRDKDVSLERSLDLFDEALALGAAAVELVDTTDFTPEEEARLGELASETAESAIASADHDTSLGGGDDGPAASA